MSIHHLVSLNAKLDAVEFARQPNQYPYQEEKKSSKLATAAKIAGTGAALYGGAALGRGVANYVGRPGGWSGLGRALRGDPLGTSKGLFMRGARMNNASVGQFVGDRFRSKGNMNTTRAMRATSDLRVPTSVSAIPVNAPVAAPHAIAPEAGPLDYEGKKFWKR